MGGTTTGGQTQGMVLGRDGMPILGGDGKPIMAPLGTRIGPDGLLYGPNGKPVLGKDGKPIAVDKKYYEVPKGPPQVIGGTSQTQTPGGGLTGSKPGLPTGQSVRTVGGISGINTKGLETSVRTLTGDNALAQRMGQQAAAAEAAQRAALKNAPAGAGGPGGARQVPTQSGSGPMLPPGGMGAGAGAGAGGGQERKRTTWLSEDEDVWAETKGVSGVIGRPAPGR
ncbi:hypothetical protein EF918_34705 [Streptomyces sp. WAC06614]|nr:hypothetical protein EF918_34705 [Streptomyces sp. WAC06614]